MPRIGVHTEFAIQFDAGTAGWMDACDPVLTEGMALRTFEAIRKRMDRSAVRVVRRVTTVSEAVVQGAGPMHPVAAHRGPESHP